MVFHNLFCVLFQYPEEDAVCAHARAPAGIVVMRRQLMNTATAFCGRFMESLFLVIAYVKRLYGSPNSMPLLTLSDARPHR
jgi:hypothetical protein